MASLATAIFDTKNVQLFWPPCSTNQDGGKTVKFFLKHKRNIIKPFGYIFVEVLVKDIAFE
jgi:hypothetical protein